jgi:Ser/Thr protein kinase RdoA (MazF antagonist)
MRSMTDEELAEQIGEGLAKLVARIGARVIRAQKITTLALNNSRRTYRIWLADGRQVKASHYVTERFGKVAGRIRQAVGDSFFPALVAERGNAVMEEWIAGEVLSGRVTVEGLRECGRILGRLHGRAVPEVDDLGFAPLGMTAWFEKMRGNLAGLVDGKVLEKDVAQMLEEVAQREMPKAQRLGIVHRDMCPENLVRDAYGRLFVVDNETLTIGSIEEDLCRVWYRWPMTATEREAFAGGYAEVSDPAAFENPALFWRIVVVVNSAGFRLSVSPQAAKAAMERLPAKTELTTRPGGGEHGG